MNESTWDKWFGRAADAGTAYLESKNKRPAAAAAPASAPAQQPAWIKPALIGGAVLAVLAILFAVFKK
jgi:hypothetical protein